MIRTIGELIEALKPLEVEKPIYYDFGYLKPSGIHSYRGYYDQVAIGYTSQFEEVTVKDLLQLCNKGLTESFYGWKGGDYTYSEGTNIWIAEPDIAPGVVIDSIEDFDYEYVIHTKKLKDQTEHLEL